jgi:hypothetical protein
MALDPEIVEQYATAKQSYEAAAGDLDAREDYRAKLAAYILDLDVNGMSIPQELKDAEQALLDAG